MDDNKVLRKYEGGYVNGLKQGQGFLIDLEHKLIYIGEFKNNRFNGQGTLFNLRTGEYFRGEFKNGYVTQGLLKLKDGQICEGNFTTKGQAKQSFLPQVLFT